MRGPRRRLLFLVPFPPRLDGAHGGSRAIAQLLHALATRHDVGVLSLRHETEPTIDEQLRGRCAFVEEIRSDRGLSLTDRARRRLAVLRGVPRWAAALEVSRFGARAVEIARTWNADVVHFEYHVMAQYAVTLAGCRALRILTEYEPGIQAAEEHVLVPPGLKALRHHLDRRAWQTFERRIMTHVDAIVVFTERDRATLARLTARTPIAVIPLGFRVPARALDPVGADGVGPKVLFIGNFMHPPNEDAASWLVEHIFPRVRAARPDSTLQIIGADPPPRLRRPGGVGVDVLGRVPDVAPYLDRAALVVAPLRIGGGMRVKVLEALAHGKAVVASSRALEGATVEDDVHVAVAETDDQFVRTILQLLEDTERRRRLAVSARDWALRNLGEERWISDYERLYARLLDERERPIRS